MQRKIGLSGKNVLRIEDDILLNRIRNPAKMGQIYFWSFCLYKYHMLRH